MHITITFSSNRGSSLVALIMMLLVSSIHSPSIHSHPQYLKIEYMFWIILYSQSSPAIWDNIAVYETISKGCDYISGIKKYDHNFKFNVDMVCHH